MKRQELLNKVFSLTGKKAQAAVPKPIPSFDPEVDDFMRQNNVPDTVIGYSKQIPPPSHEKGIGQYGMEIVPKGHHVHLVGAEDEQQLEALHGHFTPEDHKGATRLLVNYGRYLREHKPEGWKDKEQKAMQQMFWHDQKSGGKLPGF